MSLFLFRYPDVKILHSKYKETYDVRLLVVKKCILFIKLKPSTIFCQI